MRVSLFVSLFISLFALALISTASAEGTSPKACSKCWQDARNALPECKKLSKDDLKKIESLNDVKIASLQNKPGGIIPCLCRLTKETGNILSRCASKCPKSVCDGLLQESQIVGSAVCEVSKNKLLQDQQKEKNGQDNNHSGSTGTSESNSTASSSTSSDGVASALPQLSIALLAVASIVVSAITF